MKQRLLIAVISIFFGLPCLHAQTSTSKELEAAKKEISQSNLLFNQAFVKGDSTAIVALYHSEAKLYPPNMKAMNKAAEMGHMITGIPSSGIKSATLTSTEVLGSGDLVIEMGTYEMSDGTNTVDNGKYIVVWKKENGKYKMYRDIWNSNAGMMQH